MSQSKSHFICRGGWDKPKPAEDDDHGREDPGIKYKEYGCGLVIFGVFCALLAPSVLLPSSIGVVPVEFEKEFLTLSSFEQYIHLLRINSLVVLKSALSVDLIGSVSLPIVPKSNIGVSVIVAIALLDFLAILCIGIGAWRIYSNYVEWAKNHAE